MTTITTPTAPNAAQWVVVEKCNGRLAIKGNAFKEFIRTAGLELLKLASEEEDKDNA